MPYVTLDTFHPVLVTRRVGLAGPTEVREMLDWVDAHLDRAKQSIAFVYDAGADPSGRPDAKARQVGGEWLRARRAALLRACAGIDFAFPNTLSRGALTAVFWITEPPMPYGIHGSAEAAAARAIARVGLAAEIDVARVVAALDAISPR